MFKSEEDRRFLKTQREGAVDEKVNVFMKLNDETALVSASATQRGRVKTTGVNRVLTNEDRRAVCGSKIRSYSDENKKHPERSPLHRSRCTTLWRTQNRVVALLYARRRTRAFTLVRRLPAAAASWLHHVCFVYYIILNPMSTGILLVRR